MAKMINYNFRGLMAPVFTPFNNDVTKTLNLDIIPTYANYLLNHGIKGILVNGTSGEGMSMTVQERKAVTEKWVEACKNTKQSLMIQIGGAPLPDVIDLAKHAEQNKVDALLCLPELYFKPKTSLELIKYLSVISNAAPETPLLYYHIPMFTHVNINMPEFLKEANNRIKTLVGIKFTSCDLNEGTQCINICDKKYSIFLGADQIMAGAFTMGFNSAIATTINIYPNLNLDILEHSKKIESDGKFLPEAQRAQQLLTKYINVITKYGSWVASMKMAMNMIAPFQVGPVRFPLEDLTDTQQKMYEEMKNVV